MNNPLPLCNENSTSCLTSTDIMKILCMCVALIMSSFAIISCCLLCYSAQNSNGRKRRRWFAGTSGGGSQRRHSVNPITEIRGSAGTPPLVINIEMPPPSYDAVISSTPLYPLVFAPSRTDTTELEQCKKDEFPPPYAAAIDLS